MLATLSGNTHPAGAFIVTGYVARPVRDCCTFILFGIPHAITNVLCVVFRVCVCDARGGARRREAARGGARRRVVARGGVWWPEAARGGALRRVAVQRCGVSFNIKPQPI